MLLPSFSIFPLSPENEFAVKILALAALTATVAVAHVRYICHVAGKQAAAEFDARMARLDLLTGRGSETE